MLFDSDPRHRLLRKGSREFIEQNCPLPRVRELLDHSLGFDRTLWKQAAFLGWYGMLMSERYGGFHLTSQPLVDLVVVAEELGRLVQPGPVLVTNVVAYAIDQFGTDEQKQQHLLAVASGDTIATWCLAEGEHRWASRDLAITISESGDRFVVNGTKVFVQDAEAADLLLLTGRADSGVVQLLIPTRPRGITLWPRRGIDPTRRFYDVHFDNVVVSASARLGARDSTMDHIDEQLRVAKVLQCAESAAGAIHLVDNCVNNVRSRHQFQQQLDPLAAVHRRIADLRVAADVARAATYFAAHTVSDGGADAGYAVDAAEIVVNDAYAFIAEESIQMRRSEPAADDDIQLYLDRAKCNRVIFGDAADHRRHVNDLVADAAVDTSAPET
ncbi:hypothetical protein AWB91_09630 [Mycobacterium paraense]|uniref:Acyl-CoA dehydrogenase n=1 Tax=Mycobacterium paraense TaxID=767916 RepID=A0ABX3VRQ2_9MYCO|nr:acyl-CoA dehydrogenase family protein [Mycobacterium paraense]ORW32741.1 hypothetical protein AWB91_09630 [Mycobacterium paraense]ORW44966.1 hypothetical protein AWB88_04700 [Mycobacterium paraense]